MALTFDLTAYAGAVDGLELTSVIYEETGTLNDAGDGSGHIVQIRTARPKCTIKCEGTVVNPEAVSHLTVGIDLEINHVVYRIDHIKITVTTAGSGIFSFSGVAPLPPPAE